jgi:predicted MFS family arabinose efflux permease
LLFQYYMDAGVHNAHQREWLSSLYSAAQIVGGLLLGMLTDAGSVSHRTVLQTTFAGAAISYGLIAYGQSIYTLMASRMIVGLIKHSYTVSSALMSTAAVTGTTKDRSRHIGRLNSAMTIAWIIGPSIGAILHHNVGKKVPVMLACALFLVNFTLVTLLLENTAPVKRRRGDDSREEKKSATFWSSLTSCFRSRALASAVIGRLLVAFVIRATNSSQLGTYYEEMYGLERHQRGYLSSYGQGLQLIVQSLLVTRVLHWMGGERRAIVLCAVLILGCVLVETYRSLWLYLLVITPLSSVATAVMSIALQSVLSHAAPESALFSVFAAIDVLQNAAAVLTPFYRTLLFDKMLPKSSFVGAMAGDPDPISFLWMSGAHWAIVVIALAYESMVVSSSPKQRKD